MAAKSTSVLSLVLVPAVVTLALSVVRLFGEIGQWNPLLFGKPEAGGDKALLGSDDLRGAAANRCDGGPR